MKSSILYLSLILSVLSGCEDDAETVESPQITSFSPELGYENDEVTIVGKNFSNTASENIVRFGSIQAEVLSATASQLVVLVPGGASDGSISVRVGSASGSSEQEFIVLVDLEKEIKTAMTSTDIPSLAIAVLDNGEVIYSKGFGHYDAAQTKNTDENTLYLTSSISKLIVSIAVMQQVELGKLSLDEDIGELVGFDVRNPNFPDKIITVQMVMEHGSSLSNPVGGEIIDEAFFAHKADSAIALHPIIEDAITAESEIYNSGIWMNVEPGTFHKNSNYGITLLAYMVEKLSGQHFNDYSKDHILNPMGMSSSSYYFPDIDQSRYAAIYDGNGIPFEPFSLYFYPAGMLVTSTADWLKVLQMMMNNGSLEGVKILESSSVDALLAIKYPPGNNLAYDSSIGLVWRQAAGSDGWLGHTGAGIGITHVTEFNRDKNLGYVIFSNKSANGGVIGPGGSLYVKVHKWLGQIGLTELNNN
ncbi:MAG: serine hydrolase [Reichenbachiella sp.]|uniref:serine hydrolase n=1 Tax=Reichenbachiella sp. TaxID=2184521 RepID=UPI0032672A9C